MRAVTIDRRGRVSIRTVPAPAVGRREVQIAVETSGVGSWDVSMRPGRGEDFVFAGSDGAGRVTAVGDRVRRFRKGDRVYSFSHPNPRGGFHAEYVLVSAKPIATPGKDMWPARSS